MIIEDSEGAQRRGPLGSKELEDRLTPEHKLKLAIFEKIPFTIWASTRDCKIVLWNKTSESKYGYKALDVIGIDFVDLFVDDLEKEDARRDCAAVVDQDKKFKNFLAYDRAADGATRTMLTNCFRVYDETRNEFLQVEVGVSADELNLAREEERLHSLRAMAKQRLEEREQATRALRESLTAAVTDKLDLSRYRLEMRREKLLSSRESADMTKRQISELDSQLCTVDKEIRRNRDNKLSLIGRIQRASTLADLISIQREADGG